MIAGIAIDDWKLPIFDRHLQRAGYIYIRSAGLSAGTSFLRVDTDDMDALGRVVRAANAEAATTKLKGTQQ